MRTFFSYGPVDCEEHFCVPRSEIIERCFMQLIGNPEKGGHFFTIWSPRQCGKTWLMRQVKQAIEKRYGDRYLIGMMSMQGLIMNNDDPDDIFFRHVPKLFRESFQREPPQPEKWEDWTDLFSVDKGRFERPLILFIDEFDSLPRRIIDQLVTLFRDIYLKRESFNLHGLALIGVRAVLSVESLRGSPFNIQRSLHVPNFTPEEVEDLFQQYRSESGQIVDPEVVQAVYGVSRGQPGLVCWFGELLTEKFNPGAEKPVDMGVWKQVYGRACFSEWNNTVLNLIKKVRSGYTEQAVELFAHSDIRFSIDADWCSYLYLNGVIDKEETLDCKGDFIEYCRFASPFIQLRLYNALTADLIGEHLPMLALDPLDTLSDVFEKPELDIPALLSRYKAYLKRLKAKGIDPWKGQPRRSDMHYTEYVGHFHLYFWLQNAVGRQCGISPEFPTGNGRVDLHLRCKNRQAVIEVKSFKSHGELEYSKEQAVKYAKRLGFVTTTLAVFVPVEDEETLAKLSGEQTLDGVRLYVMAIGWV
jgi:hypothetical protein